MQKEDLLRRMRLFAVISTLLFIVLIVGLLVQFGFIASYHHKVTELKQKNAQLQKDIDRLEQLAEYWGDGGEGPKDSNQTGK